MNSTKKKVPKTSNQVPLFAGLLFQCIKSAKRWTSQQYLQPTHAPKGVMPCFVCLAVRAKPGVIGDFPDKVESRLRRLSWLRVHRVLLFPLHIFLLPHKHNIERVQLKSSKCGYTYHTLYLDFPLPKQCSYTCFTTKVNIWTFKYLTWMEHFHWFAYLGYPDKPVFFLPR